MFELYDNLAGRSYYWVNDSHRCFKRLDHILHNPDRFANKIDPVALCGILMKNYVIGDRTLIKDVKRSPWMAKPDGDGGWLRAEVPKHEKLDVTFEEAALCLKRKLRNEALCFLAEKKTVGILLSGGMDSRVVAGIVRELQETGEFSGDVVALTWGEVESRDVIYARRIADQFGWEFKHFPLDAEVLSNNIELAAVRGAEYSPIHLHALDAISKTKGIDGVLAGSYGDSIGRGEYSGMHFDELPCILKKHLNHFAFMQQDIKKETSSDIRSDLLASRKPFPGRTEKSYREIEMQMHYMRRQLNVCMEVVDDRIPLYQMFGSREVFSYMWSLSSRTRRDDVYEYLLADLPVGLSEIPWSRTGKKYNQRDAVKEDSFSKINNRYGKWLRKDLRSIVTSEIGCGELQSMGVFNNKALDMWVNNWPANDHPRANRLDEKMAWLASLSIFIRKYNVQGHRQVEGEGIVDKLARLKAFGYNFAYQKALQAKDVRHK